MTEYEIRAHGDWLEKEAASFIKSSIPSYEEIWKRYIGHKGNGKMADMVGINETDEMERIDFAQHLYTVLESLYFMKLIVEEESKTNSINDFNSYRKVINQVMVFQAYSGRLRDNMGKCFLIMVNSIKSDEVHKKLDEFYHQRHVFIHGRKVPFALDSDCLFKIPGIKKRTIDTIGYGLEMPWEAIEPNDLVYLEDSLKESLNELTSEVNSLFYDLLEHVIKFIGSKNLQLKSPISKSYLKDAISGSTTSSSNSKVNTALSGTL